MDVYQRGIRWYRLNVDYLHEYSINITNDTAVVRNLKMGEVYSEEINALYYRKPAFPDFSAYKEEYIPLMQKDIMCLVEGIAETIGTNCLTRPSVLRRAEDKVLQMSLAKKVGFTLPRSLITNDAGSATHFICDQPTSIIKPLATGRIKYSDSWRNIQTQIA